MEIYLDFPKNGETLSFLTDIQREYIAAEEERAGAIGGGDRLSASFPHRYGSVAAGGAFLPFSRAGQFVLGPIRAGGICAGSRTCFGEHSAHPVFADRSPCGLAGFRG